METRLELKPFQGKKVGVKYVILQLTDITLHTSNREPSSVGKQIKKAIEGKEPGRIYQNDAIDRNGRINISSFVKNDPVLIKTIRDYESRGIKILIHVPKEGLPIYAGKDTSEYMDSIHGKRLIRKIQKDKDEK